MRSLYSPVGCSAKGGSGRCSFCFFGFLLVSVELMSRTGTVFITRAVGVVSSSGENTACCACAHTAPDIQIAEQGVGNRTKEYRPINSAVGPTKLLAGRWFPPNQGAKTRKVRRSQTAFSKGRLWSGSQCCKMS